MAFVVYWYEIVCFAIVGAAIVASVYVLISRFTEGSEELNGTSIGTDDCSSTVLEGQLVMDTCYISSSQLWTSCWRGLHPGWLLGLRLLSFLVLAAFLSWDIQKWGGSIFIYYTEWTFSLVMLYFAISSVVSAHGCWLLYTHRACIESYFKGSQVGKDLEQSEALMTKINRFNKGCIQLHCYYNREQPLNRVGFWGYLMHTIYQTCAGAVILTDIVFWCIIVPFMQNAELQLNLLTGCMHTLNFAFLLIETCLNRLPFPLYRLAYFVLWSSSYVIFQWLIHLCGFTWWPYPFLKLSTPWAPLWYLALGASHIACYGMYALVVRVKDSLLSDWFASGEFKNSMSTFEFSDT